MAPAYTLYCKVSLQNKDRNMTQQPSRLQQQHRSDTILCSVFRGLLSHIAVLGCKGSPTEAEKANSFLQVWNRLHSVLLLAGVAW